MTVGSNFNSSRLKISLITWLHLALVAPLVIYGVTGLFSRHRADDFCHSGDIFAEGFWQAQVVVYTNSSDRYSVEPLVGISEWFGTDTIRILPALVIIFWLIGLTLVIARLLNLEDKNGSPHHLSIAVLMAQLMVFFTLLTAPNRFQSLYWRAGLLTYLLPLAVQAFLLAAIVHLSSTANKKLSTVRLVGLGLLAFFAGGFSETTAALQTGCVALAVTCLFLFPFSFQPLEWAMFQNKRHQRALIPLTVALAGSLLSMLVLFLSPAAHARQSNFAAPPNLMTLIPLSLRWGWDFLIDAIKVVPLPLAACFALTLCLSLAYHHNATKRMTLQRFIYMIGGTLIIGYLLVVCCIAPSVYAYQAGMEPRAAISGRFITIIMIAMLGWFSGQSIAPHFALPARPRLFALLALSMLALSFYPLRAALQAYREIPYYQQRAGEWDARDIQIRSDSAQGLQNIETIELDSIYGIGDLKDDPNLWVNTCTARFYGVQSITASPPQK